MPFITKQEMETIERCRINLCNMMGETRYFPMMGQITEPLWTITHRRRGLSRIKWKVIRIMEKVLKGD